MKVYLDDNDIGKTITYKEENGKIQYLYVHDREGFVFKSLADYKKQVRKQVCEEIWKEFEQRLMNKKEDMPVMKVANIINSVLDKMEELEKGGK